LRGGPGSYMISERPDEAFYSSLGHLGRNEVARAVGWTTVESHGSGLQTPHHYREEIIARFFLL